MGEASGNPCAGCGGACCAQLSITVSVVDVARIVRHLQVPVSPLLARYVDEDPAERPYVFWIRRQPIALALCPPGEALEGCPFLMRVGEDARCGIYGFRPGTCRVYPYTRTAGRITHKRNALCPHAFKPDEAELAWLQAEIDTYQAEWDLHARFCRQWNEDPPRYPSFEKLVDFVDALIASGQI